MIQNHKLIKSEFIELVADKQRHLPFEDVEDSVNCILDHIAESLEHGENIEIRGFGTFSLHKRPAKIGRNPQTGELVPVPEKYAPHFKPGKALRDSLNIKSDSFCI